jgi:Carboxypeptidase regulatory-like domain
MVAFALPLLVANPACAQNSPPLVHLRGRTVDSTGRGIPGVQLTIVGSGRTATSDSVGFFAIDSLAAGIVSVSFVHPRFALITLDLPVSPDTARMPVILNAAVVPPLAAPAPSMLLGRVTDQTGFAIVGADILIASSGQTATTDTLGRFIFTGLRPQRHFLRVRKIGYYAQYLNVTSTATGAVRASIALESMGTSLSEVVVHADRTTPRLKRFYDRKALGGSGQFATREEFAERGWTTLRDVLSNMRGVRIGSDEWGRPTLVTGTGRDCPMSVLLDGQAFALDAVSLTAMISLRDLAGVEVYRDAADMPMEFRFAARVSGGCGVAVLWTR